MQPVVITIDDDAQEGAGGADGMGARLRALEALAREARAGQARQAEELAGLRASLEGVVQILEATLAPPSKRRRG